MAEAYFVTCWNCLGEFDAVAAVWCSDDPKNPTKLCPFCLRCFCDATSEYKQRFWHRAPAQLVEELQTLGRSQDRLGDILIRMKRITTPQLLEALVEQRDNRRFEILTKQFAEHSDADGQVIEALSGGEGAQLSGLVHGIADVQGFHSRDESRFEFLGNLLRYDEALREGHRIHEREPDRFFHCDQYANENNWLAHFHETAGEILLQTDGKLTHFVSGIGTGGTITGVGRRLKKDIPSVEIVQIVPEDFPGIEGLKPLESPGDIIPKILDASVVALATSHPACSCPPMVRAPRGVMVS